MSAPSAMLQAAQQTHGLGDSLVKQTQALPSGKTAPSDGLPTAGSAVHNHRRPLPSPGSVASDRIWSHSTRTTQCSLKVVHLLPRADTPAVPRVSWNFIKKFGGFSVTHVTLVVSECDRISEGSSMKEPDQLVTVANTGSLGLHQAS